MRNLLPRSQRSPSDPLIRGLHAGVASIALLLAASAAMGAVKLGPIFVDHAVLQRDRDYSVWGTGDVNADVKVVIGEQTVTGKSDGDGKWKVAIKAIPAGGPFTLTATVGADSAKADDLLFGDVYLCSGQSNMQYSVKEAADGAAIASMAASHPKLRLGKVNVEWKDKPETKVGIKWTGATPETATDFSAVAYFTAHELLQDPKLADIPIGMLQASMGATVIESWLPSEAMKDFDDKDLQRSFVGKPAGLYNGMIAPLGEAQLSGVLWYQGEGNAGRPERYRTFLPRLFETWRKQFGTPELPFYVIQLPDYATDWGGVYWQWMRDAQAQSVAATPHTAMVMGINTNDGWNLHPQGKHEIAKRASLLLRRDIYKEDIIARGPVFKDAKVGDSDIRVNFDTAGDGLSSGTNAVNGFELAGDDGRYHAADAMIDGDSVVVSSSDVKAPKNVRYAWSGVPRSTLTNKSGLIAEPFRTDDQPISKDHGEGQQELASYVYKGKDYRITISGKGHITSLVAFNQQLISNAPDSWGGSTIGSRQLSAIRFDGNSSIESRNPETVFKIDFSDDGMKWSITNAHKKEAVKFHLAISPTCEATMGDDKVATIKRRVGGTTVTGIDRIIAYNDIASDSKQVLEADIPAGATKVLEVKFKN